MPHIPLKIFDNTFAATAVITSCYLAPDAIPFIAAAYLINFLTRSLLGKLHAANKVSLQNAKIIANCLNFINVCTCVSKDSFKSHLSDNLPITSLAARSSALVLALSVATIHDKLSQQLGKTLSELCGGEYLDNSSTSSKPAVTHYYSRSFMERFVSQSLKAPCIDKYEPFGYIVSSFTSTFLSQKCKTFAHMSYTAMNKATGLIIAKSLYNLCSDYLNGFAIKFIAYAVHDVIKESWTSSLKEYAIEPTFSKA
jgi:hypothetical protein